ncbi:MAG: hypothetical protein ACP5GX_08150 [Anaerolineae bacterium]
MKGHGTLYTKDGERLTEADFRIVETQQGQVGVSNVFEAVIPRGKHRDEETIMINLKTDEIIDPSFAELVLESDKGERFEIKIENYAQRMLRGQVQSRSLRL